MTPLEQLAPVVSWTARALTFFNVLVLLWLGLTILLTAERRRFGTWLTGGGLLLGGFCSILRASAQAAQPSPELVIPDLWWRLSWLPFAGASYLWSVVLTWYAGHLRTRAEWRAVTGLSLLGCGVFVLLLVARPPAGAARLPWLPTPSSLTPSFETAPGDARLALAVYLTFVLLCIGFGLHALHHPGSPDRFMGELASRRARPWLTATSLVTLGLSTIVGVGVTGVTMSVPLIVLDLLGALLLAAHVVLLGQAIVTYEVFTGKTLPRRGLVRYWRNALILAAGFGGLMALSLGLPLDQSYRLLLALVIVAIFYALLSWRSFVERERSLEQLRPFVASERLVDHLLTLDGTRTPFNPRPGSALTIPPGSPPDSRPSAPWPLEGEEVGDLGKTDAPACEDAAVRIPRAPSLVPREAGARGAAIESDPFRALCDDLLSARVAYLCPVGPLASLVGAPLAIPGTATPPPPEVLAALAGRIGAERPLCLPVDPVRHHGASWAVPLWGERSLMGLLLLGDRHDGSLYVQEEIEIARAAGERLIDARAAGELARRLLLLQRRRLAEDQVLDGRVRRALHDDVLPSLHTALLVLNRHGRALTPQAARAAAQAPSAAASPVHEAASLLADAHRQVSLLLASLPPAIAPDVERLGAIGALRRVVDDLSGELDGVTWEIDPAAERMAAALPPLTAEVLFGAAREAVRNAARHARGAVAEPLAEPDGAAQVNGSRRPLHLLIAATFDPGSADDPGRHPELTLRVEDDGVGVAAGAGTHGSGQGLVLHGTLLAVLGGTLAMENSPGAGTRVVLRVPAPA